MKGVRLSVTATGWVNSFLFITSLTPVPLPPNPPPPNLSAALHPKIPTHAHHFHTHLHIIPGYPSHRYIPSHYTTISTPLDQIKQRFPRPFSPILRIFLSLVIDSLYIIFNDFMDNPPPFSASSCSINTPELGGPGDGIQLNNYFA
jgi:hypothetical protein